VLELRVWRRELVVTRAIYAQVLELQQFSSFHKVLNTKKVEFLLTMYILMSRDRIDVRSDDDVERLKPSGLVSRLRKSVFQRFYCLYNDCTQSDFVLIAAFDCTIVEGAVPLGTA
jgi:hypothetical protein